MANFTTTTPSPEAANQQELLFTYAKEDFYLSSSSTDFYSRDDYRISPPIDQVYRPNFDLDTKWRSVAVANQFPNHFNSSANQFHVKESLLSAKKSIPGEDTKGIMVDSCNSSSSGSCYMTHKLAGDFKAPEQPLLLMPTHFETCVPISCTVALVERALHHFSEVSFEMVADDCTWNAVYLRGSAHCNMQVHIYSHGSAHIVEANKISGDGAAFRLVWNQIKALMNNESVEQPRVFDSFGLATSLPTIELLSDEEAVEALQPILQMAKSGLLEPQLEAARLFCDLSLHDAMQQHMCDSGCVQALVENLLPCIICEWTRQHAVFALANLSEAQGCQEAMIDAGILPVVLNLVKDGPYNTIEMRRECARILANLSARLATRVVNVLGPRTLSVWLEKVDALRDERLKLHAHRARESLTVVFTT